MVKHAAASEVCITVTTDPDAFTLSVRDNGTGFVLDASAPVSSREQGRPTRGNGLANMRQRLAKLRGHCDILTAPGNGTEVKFVVPAAAHRSREKG